MSYAILKFKKQRGATATGVEKHHEREKNEYKSNPNIEPEKSYLNYHLIKPKLSYKEEIDKRIEKAACKVKTDSVKFIDTVITASPIFFHNKTDEEIKAFFKHALAFLAYRVGRENIFTAVIHRDEKTAHMHVCFTPITKDKRLSAKAILGNQLSLSKWQDGFYFFMRKYYPEFERGKRFNRIVNQKEILTVQLEYALECTLEDIKRIKVEMRRLLYTLSNNLYNKSANYLRKLRKIYDEKTVELQESVKRYEQLTKTFSNINEFAKDVPVGIFPKIEPKEESLRLVKRYS